MTDKIRIVNESTKNSIVTDAVTFGILIGSFWFNHQFLGDGIILQLVLGVCFFFGVFAAASRKPSKTMTVDEAKEYFCKEPQ